MQYLLYGLPVIIFVKKSTISWASGMVELLNMLLSIGIIYTGNSGVASSFTIGYSSFIIY